jgi:hypothetical protein
MKGASVGRFKLEDDEDLLRNGIRDEEDLLNDVATEIKGKDWIGFKRGYLRKTKIKSKVFFSMKTRRHFTLVNEFMVYRQSHADAFPKAAYNLLSVKGVGIVGQNSFVLDFVDDTSSGIFVAKSHPEATLWVQAIRARIQLIKTNDEFRQGRRRGSSRLHRRVSSNLIDIDTIDEIDVDRQRTQDNWVSLFDSLFVDSPSASSSVTTTKAAKKDNKRQYIISEIMSTEQNYVNSLSTLINVYRKVAMENVGRSGWLSEKSILIVFDKLIPLAMMHEKLLNDIKRVVEKRMTPTTATRTSSSHDELLHNDPFSSIPSAYNSSSFFNPTGTTTTTTTTTTKSSSDKKDLFDLAFDSPSFRMDEDLKTPLQQHIDECSLSRDVEQNIVDVFSSSHQILSSSPKNHSHPPPLPPRNDDSTSRKAPEPLKITRAPTGFGGFKPSPSMCASPKIRFAAQLSAERRARHNRSPSEHRTETLISPKKNTDECETVEEAIGVVFATYAHFFLIYKDFIHSYAVSANHLQRKCKTKSRWGAFCEEQKRANHGCDIFSLMIQPVQRMPRYRLLILELLKSTPDDASYRSSLKDALSNLERALEISNNST